jgi:hypothetical protein
VRLLFDLGNEATVDGEPDVASAAEVIAAERGRRVDREAVLDLVISLGRRGYVRDGFDARVALARERADDAQACAPAGARGVRAAHRNGRTSRPGSW